MDPSHPDLQRPDELSELLWHVLLFVDALNSACVVDARSSAAASGASQRALKDVLGEAIERLNKAGGWHESDLMVVVRAVMGESAPQLNQAVVAVLRQHLLETVRDAPLPQSTAVKHLWLRDRASEPAKAWAPHFSSSKAILSGKSSRCAASIRILDEAVDPFFVMQNFLVQACAARPLSIDHYIQRWLRRFLQLGYEEAKYPLARVCARFNQIFYGVSAPTQHIVQARRPPTVGLAFILAELGKALAPHGSSSDASESKCAFGLFLCLRFCRVLRVRTVWGDPATAGALARPHICVEALRPLDYTYFQSRVIGSIFGISGLNWIFRGGLLPRTSNGRTYVIAGEAGSGKTSLALHFMADMASRGQLAVYVSLEESYDTLVSRLVAFGLADSTKFDIVSSAQFAADPKELSASGKGLLLLYGSSGERFSLIEVIERLSGLATAVQQELHHAKKAVNHQRFQWRGVAIDSVNGLDPADPGVPERARLRELVDCIDRHRFWGLLVSEAEGREVTFLRYLADTVIEVGRDELATRGRWLEIQKCRTQYFHTGKHPFRILEGTGIVIYPSLESVRDTLRRRARSTLSQERAINWPEEIHFETSLPALAAGSRELLIREKSSTLISGPRNSGKAHSMMRLLTAPSMVARRPGDEAPRSALVVSFHVPEVRFKRMLQSTHWQDVSQKWRSIPHRSIRWYSPGENLSAAQVLAELFQLIEDGRRSGFPLQRVAFHRVDRIPASLPSVHHEALFWPTILELMSSQAITTFLVAEDATSGEPDLVQALWGMVDYSLRLTTPAGVAVLDKRPSLPPIRESEDSTAVDAQRARHSEPSPAFGSELDDEDPDMEPESN